MTIVFPAFSPPLCGEGPGLLISCWFRRKGKLSVMPKKAIETAGKVAGAPYSPGVLVGNVLYVSGQVPIAGGKLVGKLNPTVMRVVVIGFGIAAAVKFWL